MRFGTDGIRGPAGEAPIDVDGAFAVGAAAARWAAELGVATVVVGRDTRPSGDELAAGVISGVVAAGGQALDAGVLPTPALQVALQRGRATVGVMVTASHNPAADNGFKVIGPGGHKPGDAEVAHLEALLAAGGKRAAGGAVVDVSAAARADYVAALAGAMGPASLAGRRIAVDLAAGAATATFEAVAALFPGVAFVVRAASGRINDGVGSEHPAGLVALVRERACDAGVAVDGDGDRALIVDERGEIVPGDAILWALARALGARQLVATVMSTTALEAGLPGVVVTRTGVGDRLVAEAMRSSGAEVGGEESGHVLLAGAMPGGDGLFVGLRMLAACWAAAPTVSAALAPFVPFPRRLTKVRCAARREVAELGVDEVVRAAEAELGPGRVFLRWSGTEPVLRVLVEGPDAAVVARASDAVTAACAAALGAS